MAGKGSWRKAIVRKFLASPQLDRHLLRLRRSLLEAAGALEQFVAGKDGEDWKQKNR